MSPVHVVSGLSKWDPGRKDKTPHTADLEGCLELQKDGLAEEDLAGLVAQPADLGLGEVHVLALLCATHWLLICVSYVL